MFFLASTGLELRRTTFSVDENFAEPKLFRLIFTQYLHHFTFKPAKKTVFCPIFGINISYIQNMKKRIIILSTTLAILSLMVFGFMQGNKAMTVLETTANETATPPEKDLTETKQEKSVPSFFFGIGTRFNAIKKRDLDQARSLIDFLGHDHVLSIISYNSVTVTILDEDKPTNVVASGHEMQLNAAQLELLKASEISTNILIDIDYKIIAPVTGILEDSSWTPYLTVVPEKQAEYIEGNEALLEHIRRNSIEKTPYLNNARPKAGKLNFTVDKTGKIHNLKLSSSCGDPIIDVRIKELMLDSSNKWKPAENTDGEKVEQSLILSFGSMGC